MLRNISREQVVGVWIAAVIVMMVISVIAGAAITFSSAALWLIGGVVPPGVTLLLWHAEPLTVSPLPSTPDGASKGGRS
jgi:hypothetical protein